MFSRHIFSFITLLTCFLSTVVLAVEDLEALGEQHWLVSSEQVGLTVLDAKLNIVSELKGSFELADTRALGDAG